MAAAPAEGNRASAPARSRDGSQPLPSGTLLLVGTGAISGEFETWEFDGSGFARHPSSPVGPPVRPTYALATMCGFGGCRFVMYNGDAADTWRWDNVNRDWGAPTPVPSRPGRNTRSHLTIPRDTRSCSLAGMKIPVVGNSATSGFSRAPRARESSLFRLLSKAAPSSSARDGLLVGKQAGGAVRRLQFRRPPFQFGVRARPSRRHVVVGRSRLDQGR
jgi:hypothetical protein